MGIKKLMNFIYFALNNVLEYKKGSLVEGKLENGDFIRIKIDYVSKGDIS